MPRSIISVLVLAASIAGAGHAAPAPDARTLLEQADRLFDAGRYQAALGRFEGASVAAGGGEAERTRALLGAVKCEIPLGRLERALDRVRAAPLPRTPA